MKIIENWGRKSKIWLVKLTESFTTNNLKTKNFQIHPSQAWESSSELRMSLLRHCASGTQRYIFNI